MADSRLYRHVRFKGLGEAPNSFIAPRGGSAERAESVKDRRGHADALLGQLTEVRANFSDFANLQKSNSVPKNLRGIPLTIQARSGEPLTLTGSPRSTSSTLKLLNLRRTSNAVRKGDHNDGPDFAVFFATESNLKTLQRSIDTYGDWVSDGQTEALDDEDDDSRRPGNFWLFESSDTIREANLQDLWVDPLDRFPRRKAKTNWEVWIRPDLEDYFLNALSTHSVDIVGRPTKFVETVVRTVHASHDELNRVMKASGAIVSLRSASTFTSDFYRMLPLRRTLDVQAMATRLKPPPRTAPRVTVLDTGVKSAHPLLRPALPPTRCHTVEGSWGTADHHGHGTRMAGLALYGDMATIVSANDTFAHELALESVVVSEPVSETVVPARDAIERAVGIVEREKANRIFCLAQTAAGETETGVPSSTSAVIDDLAYGKGENPRLFCVAVGNAPHSHDKPYQKADYDRRNFAFPIQSPAQALNALAIGAVALKNPKGDLLAPAGDLAPTSRTSEAWASSEESLRFFKPDIVLDGGNFQIDEDDVFCRPSAGSMPLTTSRDAPASAFAHSGESSTATALAANLAARLLARYPDMRMETLRALMVNSADWTPAMLGHHSEALAELLKSGDACARILGKFGWGVPNVERLFSSSENALTMIAEDVIQPFELSGNSITIREMKFFKLPWPSEVLSKLGNTEVEMRCTLSYFIEPEPHAASRDRLDRYPSFRLKMDVKRHGESDTRAKRRVNWAEATNEASGSDDGWLLGDRQRGSLVHDIWRGKAFHLADRDAISVSPIKGWWSDIKSAHRYDRAVNFSLVVSIRTPAGTGDMVAEVLTKVPEGVLVEQVSEISNAAE